MKLLLLVLLVGLALSLQHTSAPGPQGAAKHGLEWQIGEWKGLRRAASDGTENPMTMRVTSILGGAGLTYEMTIPTGEGPEEVYRGFSVQVFDPVAKLWRRRYVNDVRRTFSELEGRLEDGHTSWRSVSLNRTREYLLVSERPEPDRWVRTMTISEDGGATWTGLWTDELTR